MTTDTMADYDVAEALAPTWERRRRQIEEVCAPPRDWLVRELAPREGETVLELGAGTGDTGFDAAELLGKSGKLISSDFSPSMVAAARRRGGERGVENVEYRVLDAERIDLPDDAVDAVICRFAYMLIADPAAALGETRRVLRGGGRLALAVWGPPERNPLFAIIAAALVDRGHIPPPDPPPAPGIFAMASSERTGDLLAAAGFNEVRTEQVELRFPVPSAEAYIEFVADTAGPLALALQRLARARRTELARDVEAALAPFAADDGYELPGVALCAVGR